MLELQTQKQAPDVLTRPPVRRRRRWWQHLLRATAGLVLLLIVAYASLPWWLPRGLLREYLCSDLSRQLGVPVQIESLSVSWGEGLEIAGLSIASEKAYGTRPLVSVQAVRVDFSPLTYLFRKTVDWMVVDRPHLFVQFEPGGNSNLDVLSDMPDLHVRLVSVHDSVVDLRLPDEPRLLRLNVGDLQVLSGRLQRLSRLTMSAFLEQPGDPPAPVTLRLQTSRGGPHLADAAFSFANINLDSLHLPKLLEHFGPRLTRLGGRCNGGLILRMDSRGVVDRFELNVLCRELDVQGLRGRRLPVFDEAHLAVRAAFDPLTNRVDLQSADIRLPGIELTGKASFLADLQGNWLEVIGPMDFKGRIYPARLAMLLTGSSALREDLAIDGPLDVQFAAHRQENRMHLDVVSDATGAVFRRGATILKPAGRALRWEFNGLLDGRQWQFEADKSLLVLGANVFDGRGSVRDLDRLIQRYVTAGRQVSPADILKDFQCLDWQGTFEIRDLPSLCQAMPGLGAAAHRVELKGMLSGQISLGRRNDARVGLGLEVPADAELTVGDFHKPAGTPMDLRLWASVDPAQRSFKNVNLDLTFGEALVHAAHGYVRFGKTPESSATRPASAPASSADAWAVEAGGEFDLDQVEGLAEVLPAALRTEVDLGGGAEGDFVLRLDRGGIRADVTADLKGLKITSREFSKPSGTAADVAVQYTYQAGQARDWPNNLTARATLPCADLQASASFLSLESDERGTAQARVEISDAAAAAALSPYVRNLFQAGKLWGQASGQTNLQWEGQNLSLEVHGEGKALGYAVPGGRHKDPGVPLSLAFRCGLRNGGKTIAARIDSARIDLAGSNLQVSGNLGLDRAKLHALFWPSLSQTPSRLEGFLQALDRLEVRVQADCAADRALCDALPELGCLAARGRISGSANATARLWSDRDDPVDHGAWNLTGRLDAGKLTVGGLGGFAKPADVPAEVELRAALKRDYSELGVNALRMQAGKTGMLADGRAVNLGRGLKDFRPRLSRAHVWAWTEAAQEFQRFCPALAARCLSGGAQVELEADNTQGMLLPVVDIHARDLCGQLGSRQVRMDGELRLTDVRPRVGKAPQIARMHTDGLELGIGENHVWLLTDLSNLPDKAKGSIQVLASYLSDKDIADWIDSLKDAASPATSMPSTAGQDWAGSFLADFLGNKELAEAIGSARGHERQPELKPEERAQRLIKDLRPLLAEASVTVSLSADHFKTYDPAVRQWYDVMYMQMDGGVDRGAIQIEYAGGLNGGTVRTKIHTGFSDPNPLLDTETAIRDVKANKNIRPQIEMYFPGNIVEGFFSRQEQTTLPLRDAIANAIDYRYPRRPSGTAKTITTDGYVQGQGAPRFVTRVFPGLNLTRYQYKTMTGYAELHPDGSALNDMIFSGTSYNVYIEGVTFGDNRAEYEIGLVLTSSPESNHTLRQGRIPILKFKGRIEGGKIYDQVVSYPWPNETLFKIFLENNIFYRLWLNRQK